MPRRTTTPLSSTERSRRFRMNHPEKTEEYRLAMQKLRAARRQQEDLKRLALVEPTEDEADRRIAEKVRQAARANMKISTGLAQEDIPAKPDMSELLRTIQGSKV